MRAKRVPVRGQLRIRADGRQFCALLADLSAVGAGAAQLDAPLKVGAKVELTLVAGDWTSREIEAEVIWQRNFRAGFRFLPSADPNLSRDIEDALRPWSPS